jgi:hypothetical protein
MITPEQLVNWFTYHPPREKDIPAFLAIREAGKEFAATVIYNTPPGEDQVAAVRKIREAVMMANAAIACKQEAP